MGGGSSIENIEDFLKNSVKILKDPREILINQRVEKVWEKEENFSEYTSPILLAKIFEKMNNGEILYVASKDEFEGHTGKPSFMIIKNGDSFMLAEHYHAHEGSKFTFDESLNKEEIIQRVSPEIDCIEFKEQLMILTLNEKMGKEKPLIKGQSN